MAERKKLEPSHLGDGVYIHDEGHGIQLAVNHHRNKVIYMDRNVLKNLVHYLKKAEFITDK